MGRSYWFECCKCGYRARVSGRPDRGLNLFVQTVACHECRALFDAVTRVRVPADHLAAIGSSSLGLGSLGVLNPRGVFKGPPEVAGALNRLACSGVHHFKWIEHELQCPISPLHCVHEWNDPGKCPRCGVFMVKNAVPFRIWD